MRLVKVWIRNENCTVQKCGDLLEEVVLGMRLLKAGVRNEHFDMQGFELGHKV